MKVGKTYKVAHARKGIFVIEVTHMTSEWVTGIMREGTTRVMVPENQKFVGEEVTLRIGFLKNIEEVADVGSGA
jgi:hypothetical protein